MAVLAPVGMAVYATISSADSTANSTNVFLRPKRSVTWPPVM